MEGIREAEQIGGEGGELPEVVAELAEFVVPPLLAECEEMSFVVTVAPGRPWQ